MGRMRRRWGLMVQLVLFTLIKNMQKVLQFLEIDLTTAHHDFITIRHNLEIVTTMYI